MTTQRSHFYPPPSSSSSSCILTLNIKICAQLIGSFSRTRGGHVAPVPRKPAAVREQAQANKGEGRSAAEKTAAERAALHTNSGARTARSPAAREGRTFLPTQRSEAPHNPDQPPRLQIDPLSLPLVLRCVKLAAPRWREGGKEAARPFKIRAPALHIATKVKDEMKEMLSFKCYVDFFFFNLPVTTKVQKYFRLKAGDLIGCFQC